ncbi:hypothetical protein [Caenispirillum bisanense]|uniref:hypothetical protein n=1 Tax=Caenispirillum bisanense TaxID=414052 RepID=UPI0031DDF858
MTASAAARTLPPQTAEQTILEGLLYLEREAHDAGLPDLAHAIRAAVTVYTTAEPDKECDA